MPRRKFMSGTSLDDAWDSVVFTREAIAVEVDEADKPLATALASLVKELDPLIARGEALMTERRGRRREVSRAHARVRRRDVRADQVTLDLHHDVLGASRKGREAPLFQRFFGEAASLIVKRALESQLPFLRSFARVLDEPETPADLRKKHEKPIEAALAKGEEALRLREDAFADQGRTRARVVSWKDDANRALLGVEGALQRIAAQHGFDEEWVDGFFPVPTSRASGKGDGGGEPDAPVDKPA